MKKKKEFRIKKMRDLVEELAGSVDVPLHLKGIDIDRAIEAAKKKYFNKKFNNQIRNPRI
ncbi:hypothetical protein HYT02_00390 [Candidatus Gottesmanbacteria bacterium]|nr:hypothetical protein [Candidatus Gottesmanbacteria bacterium]